MKKFNAFKTTGTVMRGRQYYRGQDQGGSSWMLENNFMQILLHSGINLLQIQIPILKNQEHN